MSEAYPKEPPSCSGISIISQSSLFLFRIGAQPKAAGETSLGNTGGQASSGDTQIGFNRCVDEAYKVKWEKIVGLTD